MSLLKIDYKTKLVEPRVKTTPDRMLQEANEALFRAKMTLPAAAKHCGMTEKEMKLTFWEFLKYHPNLIMKSLKTPLRYPGGKSRACTKLDQYIPNLDGYKEYREPFLGGGSVAIHITKKYPHLDIWVNDLYEPLYNFWCELRDNGRNIARPTCSVEVSSS